MVSPLQQRRPTWNFSSFKSGTLRSAVKASGRAHQASRSQNLYESSDQVNHFWSDSYYKEGIAGGIDFNDGNEEDCNRIDDLGVEAEKVCPVSIPILIEASRRFIAGEAKHTHARTGAKDGSKAPPKVQQQQLARGELVAGQEEGLNLLGKAQGQQEEEPNVYLPQNHLSPPLPFSPVRQGCAISRLVLTIIKLFRPILM